MNNASITTDNKVNNISPKVYAYIITKRMMKWPIILSLKTTLLLEQKM